MCHPSQLFRVIIVAAIFAVIGCTPLIQRRVDGLSITVESNNGILVQGFERTLADTLDMIRVVHPKHLTLEMKVGASTKIRNDILNAATALVPVPAIYLQTHMATGQGIRGITEPPASTNSELRTTGGGASQ